MREVHREIVAAIIKSSDSRILLGRKDTSRDGVYADCWHLPGGGVEQGETAIAALEREIREETGIVLGNKTFVRLIDDSALGETEKVLAGGEKILCKMKFIEFEVLISHSCIDIAVCAGDDLVELYWFPVSEVHKLKLTPPARSLLLREGVIEKKIDG